MTLDYTFMIYMIIQLLTNINSPITDSYEDVKDEVIFQGLIFPHEGD